MTCWPASLARRWANCLARPSVVNKPGAQGAIASEYVARQAPDGYTLMLGYIGTHGINPACKG